MLNQSSNKIITLKKKVMFTSKALWIKNELPEVSVWQPPPLKKSSTDLLHANSWSGVNSRRSCSYLAQDRFANDKTKCWTDRNCYNLSPVRRERERERHLSQRCHPGLGSRHFAAKLSDWNLANF